MSRNKILYIAAGLTFVGLLIGIFVAAKAAFEDSPPAAQTAMQTSTSGFSSEPKGNLSGGVSKLAGSTASTRNLKGLTLRINQIESCEPGRLTAFVAVSNDAGVVSTNFTKNDVKVYLDNKEVKNFTFGKVETAKTPLQNILVIDRSGSMRGAAMQAAKDAAISYVQKLQPEDKVGVIAFDDTVSQLASLTNDKTAVINAIRTIEPRGDTAVYDAAAAGIAAVPNCGRKAVTVLSDGDDTASKNFSVQTVIAAATKANLPLFTVGLKGEGFNPAALTQIAEATGAQYIEAGTPAEISSVYERINGQLNGQFLTNFKLDIPRDGKEHVLKIVSRIEGSETSSTRSFIY